MKKKIILFYLTFSLISLFSQTTIPTGEVSGNWLINGSPYLIEGEIEIPDGQTLTIEPGCLIEFQGHYKLNVQGKLLAVGTIQNPIKFTIADTTGFSNHTIPDGGWHGIRFDFTPTTNDSSKIIYSILEFGKALDVEVDEQNGGAIYIEGYSKVLISNCKIENNISSNNGGGIYCHDAAQINNCLITNNLAYGHGGGICFGPTNPILSNSIVSYNETLTGGGGGIEVFAYSNPIIINTIISNNNSFLEGGGIRIMASIETKIINSIICNNNNHGIYAYECSPIVTNTNIVNNYGYGHLFGEYPWIEKNNDIPQDIELENNTHSEDNRVVFTNSIIWGNTEGENWIGNTSNLQNVNPMFVNPTLGCGTEFNGLIADWSLMLESMLINCGTLDTIGLYLPEYDLAGNPRIFQGEVARVDIGAYEYQEDPLRPYMEINTEQILFGYWQLNEEIDEQMFVIYNRGSVNLDIYSISAPDGFQIRTPGENWINQITDIDVYPDYFQFIYVRFHPEELGEYDNYITFVTNDVINDLQIHVDGVAVESLLRVSEDILQDTTWDNDYVIIENSITSNSNTSLTILPGTNVIHDNVNFYIRGNLNATGAVTDSIYFTSSPYQRRGRLRFGIYGGGDYFAEYCVFENSYSGVEGANTSAVEYTFINCLFQNNLGVGANLGSANSTFTNCVVRDNNSGGFIGRGVVANCIICNNGGDYAILQYTTTLDIYNSLIYNNSGGIDSDVSDYIYNNTIFNNHNIGLSIDCTFVGIDIRNNIISGNGIPGDETQIYIHPNQFHNSYIRDNIISGSVDNIVIDGNESNVIISNILDLDPEFINIQDNNYQLQETSPCIEAGSNMVNNHVNPCDLADNVRIWDGDSNGVAVIDIGCYEYGAPQYVDSDDNVIVTTPKIILHHNHPNPFNPSTTISFSISEESEVSLTVYNIKGQKVRTLVKDAFESGIHSVIWEGNEDSGKSVSSGVYFYQLKVGKNSVDTKKCLLIK